jgi:transposase InsO family protein
MYTTNPNMAKVRMEAVRLVKYRLWTTRQAARYTGYSQSAMVKWCKKDPTGGWHLIETQSSRPKHHPKELSDLIIKSIVQKRLKTKRCAEVVHYELKKEGIEVSLSSVKRTLNRQCLIKKRSPWKRYHAPMPRPEALKPGDLVQLDTIHLMKESERIYVFTLLDVFSRWAYARAYKRANTETALNFLKRASRKCSFEFQTLQSDHGPEFSMHFTERSGLVHRHSRIRMPNDNAHLERFNRTIQEECLDGLPKEIRTINKALKSYLNFYNSKRPHFGLNLKTPLEVIPSY